MGMVAVKAERGRASDPMESNLPDAGELAEATVAGLSVRIDNLDEIARAYGPGAALAASDHVRAFLNYQLRGRESLGLAEYVLRQLSENPVAYDGQRFHLFVSLAPTGGTENCANKVMPTVYGNPAFPDDAWCRHYRADMALAVNLFDAMRDDRLAMAWQPVRNADDPAAILYHECLLRVEAPDTHRMDEASAEAASTIEALERLGLIRALDRHSLAQAIAELRIEPFQSLAVNVSALSLVDDDWWTAILETLAEYPRIARRLFIEVTETAQFPSISRAANLLARLRHLGCKIVLDDFGVGHAAIRSILMFAPDVVKIDKFFVRNAAVSPHGGDTLAHMIGLAESLGAIAIVEGVETEGESRLAGKAGAVWQQGYHHGRPSLCRSWRLGGDSLPARDERVRSAALNGRSGIQNSRADAASDETGAETIQRIAPEAHQGGHSRNQAKEA